MGQNARGLTLIELLVVMSIIVLMVSLLLPAIGNARATAKVVVCGSNLRQIGVGIHAYANDFRGRIAAGPEPVTAWDLFGTNRFATPMLWLGEDYPPHLRRYTGLGLMFKEAHAVSEVAFCPDDNTYQLKDQIPHIGTKTSAFGSYQYRHLDFLPAGHETGILDNLGTNVVNGDKYAVRALVVEVHSLLPGKYGHTNHETSRSNILFRDGHASGFDNRSGALTWTPEQVERVGIENFPLLIDQVLLTADYAFQSKKLTEGPDLLAR